MVAHTYNISIREMRQKDQVFKISFVYIESLTSTLATRDSTPPSALQKKEKGNIPEWCGLEAATDWRATHHSEWSYVANPLYKDGSFQGDDRMSL